MRFEVPQFIDVEDKVFGQLTWKQFIYIAGGLGLATLVFILLGGINVIIKLAIAAPFVGIGVAFAFVEINKRPFIFYVESFFKYSLNSKKYVWQKRDKKDDTPTDVSNVTVPESVPKLSNSRLKDIAWSLDLDERKR